MTSIIGRAVVLLPCVLAIGMASGEAKAAGVPIAGVDFTTSKPTSAADWEPGALLGKPVGSATNVGAGNLLVQANFFLGPGSNLTWNVFGHLTSATSCSINVYDKNGNFIAGNSATGHNNGVIQNFVPGPLGVAGTTYILLCNVAVNDSIVTAYTTP